LEITFLSAVSLVLASIVNPTSRNEALIHAGREALKAMANRGNIPAASLTDELDRVSRLASQASKSLEVHYHLRGLEEIASGVDGEEAVNSALGSVLEIQHSDSSCCRNLDNPRGKMAYAQDPPTRTSNPRMLATPSMEN
jgi:predicted subunit of tRNA(5-methylaminomethyl-2-thiouridylate) methyltransferase